MTTQPEPRIIGGMFGLELPRHAPSGLVPAFLNGGHRLLVTARSALALLHRALAPSHVWLPSYLSGNVLPAFNEPKSVIRFYAIGEQLGIIDLDWLREVRRGDLVVFIDYFGFNTWDDWGREVRARGAWVVEDASQALLNSGFSEHAHYQVFSPRKFVGIPDGGVLLAQGDAVLPLDPLPLAPSEWWREALAASIRRADFDCGAGDDERSWFDIFQKIELSAPVIPSSMSELSAFILRHAINWAEMASKRQRNYRLLAAALGEFALFPALTDSVVPLGFPVRLANREEVRSCLFSKKIYPPVHWPLDGVVPQRFTRSHLLAGQILTIPCDQRYGPDSIVSLINAVRSAAPRTARAEMGDSP